jgi:RND family efflux transporter MFP subunit
MKSTLRRTTLPALLALALLAACGEQNRYVAPPPPKVTVAPPVQQPVTRYLEATGNTAAVNSADLVARVAGFVQSINYADGALVKKDDLLFTIEPEPYDVKLKQAQAAEQGADAALKQAQANFERQAELLNRGTGTQANYDQALAQRDQAQSSLSQAQANTRLAAINVDYAHVKAPFDGIVTARQVSVGQYVGATASPTVLASIVQTAPIYVTFNISEQDVLKIRADMARRGMSRDDLKKVAIEVALQDEKDFAHQGTLDYAAPNVNPATGTLLVRGVLPNDDHKLLPGYFARVRVPLEREDKALLVPDAALGSDQGGRYVLVVGKDDTVEQRKVEIGPQEGELRVIERGLSADDRVVVGGILRAVPGQKVEAQQAPPASGAR